MQMREATLLHPLIAPTSGKRLTVSGQLPPSDHQQSVNAQQLQMYGENWADRFGRLLRGYGISQSRLAAVIGLSAPMLSQLISGQRVKISNPAVYGRVVRLEEQLAQPAVQSGDPGQLGQVLDEVASSHPALTTMTVHTGAAGGTRTAPAVDSLAERLAAIAGRDQLRVTARAAAATGATELAAALDGAADLRSG